MRISDWSSDVCSSDLAVDAYLAATGGGDPGFVQRLRQEWGLDHSVGARLAAYLLRLATLDLGWSVVFSKPVVEVIADRIANTLVLMTAALALASNNGRATI